VSFFNSGDFWQFWHFWQFPISAISVDQWRAFLVEDFRVIPQKLKGPFLG